MNNQHWTDSLHHDGSALYVQGNHFRIGESVTVRLRVGLHAPIEGVFIRTCPDGEQHFEPMHLIGQDEVSAWWEGGVRLDMPRNHYRFWVLTAEGGWSFNAAGAWRYVPPDKHDFQVLAEYSAPDWVRDTVFYQIFPERFADGDPSNNVTTGEYRVHGHPVVAYPWGQHPPGGHPHRGAATFFGGDLQGVTQKLDYLQDLGISGVYLNPVFTSPSSHKYDVSDYYHVDPHFGGDEALIALRRALDERGMRLMLDIVPNHSSANHDWFLAAQADPDAPTAEFFTFFNHPDDYASWLGHRSLPKLNYRSERLREIMYADTDSVMRYWLREPFRADAWRVDVANMLARQGETQLAHKIGRAIRRAVKEENPAMYLLGENFFDASTQLQGDELDASMNYQGFTYPVWRWLAGYDNAHYRPWGDPTPLPTEAMIAQWTDYRATIPWQIAVQQFNALGTHDTARLLTFMSEAQARVALALLFTYPGVPSIYYGDEIGLRNRLENRECMEWDSRYWDHDLLSYYKTLIHLRRTAPALIDGGFQQLYTGEHTIAYQRQSADDTLILVARRSAEDVEAIPVGHGGLPDGAHFTEVLSGAEVVISGGMLALAGLGAPGVQIWRRKG